MPNITKINFLEQLETGYGKPKKMSGSYSLFDIGNGKARMYIRYSKIHGKNKAFYGLRHEDLKQLDGFNSFIVFLWDNQHEPVFLPYSEFEEIFNSLIPASDGQYKVQIYFVDDCVELYIATAGRFNIESFLGWHPLDNSIDNESILNISDFSHTQIQTYIGSIGISKGYDVWIPLSDRSKLDWNLTEKFNCSKDIPSRYEKIKDIVKEIDVLWINRGSSELRAFFEVEHSTPIYSGLLRFNDFYITEQLHNMKFSIVSNDMRRSLFLRQINRPTFKLSGLSDVCNFLEYKDVYFWHNRIRGLK